MKAYREIRIWNKAPLILNLDNKRRGGVSFTPWPVYPQHDSPLYPLNSTLFEPQRQSGHLDEQTSKYFFSRFSKPGCPNYSAVAAPALKFPFSSNFIFMLNILSFMTRFVPLFRRLTLTTTGERLAVDLSRPPRMSLTYSMEQSPSWEANWFCS